MPRWILRYRARGVRYGCLLLLAGWLQGDFAVAAVKFVAAMTLATIVDALLSRMLGFRPRHRTAPVIIMGWTALAIAISGWCFHVAAATRAPRDVQAAFAFLMLAVEAPLLCLEDSRRVAGQRPTAPPGKLPP